MYVLKIKQNGKFVGYLEGVSIDLVDGLPTCALHQRWRKCSKFPSKEEAILFLEKDGVGKIFNQKGYEYEAVYRNGGKN